METNRSITVFKNCFHALSKTLAPHCKTKGASNILSDTQGT